MPPLIEVERLHVAFDTYAGLVQAVRGVSLRIEPGEVLALVGESGCGKSVTAGSILKLIPSPPGKIIQGRVIFGGEDLLAKSEGELQTIRGREIGFIFQDPMTSLNPAMKVGSQVAETLKRHGKTGGRKNRIQALELLNLVGIANPERRINQYPHQLSGGMRQRVMLAMALACRPKLLVADEPTSALDVTIQAQIIELLKEIQKNTGMSILLITHDLALVAGFAQRVAVMYAGKIVETGATREIIKNPAHPYTRGLIKSLPRLDTCPGEKLAIITGRPPVLVDPPAGCSFWNRCAEAMIVCSKMEPPETAIGGSGKVSCWLVHPMAAEKGGKGL